MWGPALQGCAVCPRTSRQHGGKVTVSPEMTRLFIRKMMIPAFLPYWTQETNNGLRLWGFCLVRRPELREDRLLQQAALDDGRGSR